MPKDFTCGVASDFEVQCGVCNESYYKSVVHSTERNGEYIDISTFTKMKVSPQNGSTLNH